MCRTRQTVYCICPQIPIVSEDDWVHHILDRKAEILGRRSRRRPGVVSTRVILCHDLLRRSPRLTICSPLFLKSSKFHFHYHTTSTTFFLFYVQLFYESVFSFYVFIFYESFLRSTFFEQFLRSHFSVQSYRTQGPAADTIFIFLRPLDLPLRCSLEAYPLHPLVLPPFTPGMFPRHPYPFHPKTVLGAFTPEMFPRHPYPLHPLVLPPIYP